MQIWRCDHCNKVLGYSMREYSQRPSLLCEKCYNDQLHDPFMKEHYLLFDGMAKGIYGP